MSKQSNAPHRVLPPLAVDRVFARLVAIYGVQAVAAKYDGIDPVERAATWGSALGRATWVEHSQAFDGHAIAEALEKLAADGGAWPPSLPELVERVERVMQRPGRNVLKLPVPRRTAEELARGAEHLAGIKALLGKRIARGVAGRSREPGADDEPPAPPAACTCFVGLQRSETLCPACSAFRRGLVHRELRTEMARDGATEAL